VDGFGRGGCDFDKKTMTKQKTLNPFLMHRKSTPSKHSFEIAYLNVEETACK
jgi:hypothetical protein